MGESLPECDVTWGPKEGHRRAPSPTLGPVSSSSPSRSQDRPRKHLSDRERPRRAGPPTKARRHVAFQPQGAVLSTEPPAQSGASSSSAERRAQSVPLVRSIPSAAIGSSGSSLPASLTSSSQQSGTGAASDLASEASLGPSCVGPLGFGPSCHGPSCPVPPCPEPV